MNFTSKLIFLTQNNLFEFSHTTFFSKIAFLPQNYIWSQKLNFHQSIVCLPHIILSHKIEFNKFLSHFVFTAN